MMHAMEFGYMRTLFSADVVNVGSNSEPLLHLNLAISQRSDTGVRTEITIFCPTAKEIRRLATELNKLAEEVEKTYPNNDKQF